ncbi:MAG: helix-turn-helix domain-containing protein [Candidatus Izemoplasmataceae bacterium]
MDKTITYILLQEDDTTLKALLKEIHQDDEFKTLSNGLIKITTLLDKDEPIDYTSIYELIQTDFDQTISLLSTSIKAFNIIDETLIVEYLITLPKKVYDFESFIISLVKRNPALIQTLQKRFVQLLGYEMIETILAIAHSNMNLSITAKDHYMHRNTLHYRIDKIIDKTSINIKTFKGLSVFTIIFED